MIANKKRFTERLKEKFNLSVEMVPLRNGEDPKNMYEKLIRISKAGIDFISITKGAGGSLRGGSLPLVYFAKEKYSIESIAHFTCIKCSKEEIENTLFDYYLLGIRTILALRGDPPAGSTTDDWEGEYKYAWQVVRHIKNMNEGKYLPQGSEGETDFRKGIKTNFCIGVAAHPEEKDIELEMKYFKKKVDEGAEFAITQMIFDFAIYKNYVEKARSYGINIPIIAGIRPLIKLSQALSCENFFGIPVPEELKKRLDTDNKQKAREEGINFVVKLCEDLREFGAPGAHLFILNDVNVAEEIISRFK